MAVILKRGWGEIPRWKHAAGSAPTLVTKHPEKKFPSSTNFRVGAACTVARGQEGKMRECMQGNARYQTAICAGGGFAAGFRAVAHLTSTEFLTGSVSSNAVGIEAKYAFWLDIAN